MMGRQHRNPQQIPVCQGPDRLSWQEHKALADLEPYDQLKHPVDPLSTNQELTEGFRRWSRAAE
eukprot:10916343-Heterocapsa_arctica.AAC.1